MIENQLIPDVVIELEVEGKDILKRLLPKRMEQWTKKMQIKKDKRMNKKGKKDRDTVREKERFFIWTKLFLLIL